MANVNWSPAQIEAINAKGCNTLVSAGAGSGKTAVLTERIYQLIKNGADISKFLVMTFTNAAACEMKNRVREKLLNDPNLAHLAVAIENSHIETFDAFSLFLVKKYAFELGITPEVSIIENNFLEIKKRKFLEEILEEEYASENQIITDIVNKYCVKTDETIVNLILQISALADLKLDKEQFLDDLCTKYFDENRLNAFIVEALDEYKHQINEIINCCYKLEDADDCDAIIAAVNPLLECATYDDFYTAIKGVSFPSKSKKTKTNDKAYRDFIKKKFEKIVPKDDSDFGTSKEIIESYMSNQETVTKFVEIVKKLDEKLKEFKKDTGSYSFSDIAKFALKALNQPIIRKEMSEAFDYIMVDEYQDTSDIQEQVITLLGRDNVYMVGDVKQSIYRFRNANCGIFQDKYDRYKKGDGGKEIDLNTSYRSRRQIVNLVNEIFEKLMIPSNNIIDYSNGHHFGFGLKGYDSNEDSNIDYNLKVMNYEQKKGDDSAEEEARIIAADILEKKGKIMVYKPKDNKLVPSTFSSFAILIDRKTDFDTYRQVFTEKNIPLRVISEEPVKDSYVSQVTKNLLVLFESVKNKTFDNDFKHAYIAIARSFLAGESDQEIYDVFSNLSFEDSKIVAKINKLAYELRDSSCFEILKALYSAFDLYEKVICIGNVSSNLHKAELFLDIAANMDKMCCTISDFVTYFNDLSTFELDVAFSDADSAKDAVTLINYHKSKGLEYPFCYFPGLYKKFFRPEIGTSFLVSDRYGVVLPITGDSNRASLFNHKIKKDIVREDNEEKLRLFYVALTRARESVTLIVGHKENEGMPKEVRDCESFGEIVRNLELDQTCAINTPDRSIELDEDVFETIEKTNVEFKHVSVESYVKPHRNRASKDVVEDVDDSLLEFGTRLHYLLEVANYETKDTSFIKESNFKKYVSNVLNCGLFDNVKNDQILHEYSFFNDRDNTNGIIDCLIQKDDEIDIVDFKLKHLNDEKYEKQLNIYADYIELITTKVIKMYLISAITGEVKEVERN